MLKAKNQNEMKERIEINYGSDIIKLELRKEAIKYKLKPARVQAVKNVKEEIERAVNHPVGSFPLNKLVKKGDKVIIVADDITRSTPTKEIVPQVLDLLNQGGVPDKDITLIIALGTHRPMTEEEILQKYGQQVVKRIKIINHNYLDKNELKHYGKTRRGTDIWVNRHVVEADVRIGIGNIIPHHPMGWSGGAKILLPGVAGEDTTAQLHLLGATGGHSLGQVETPCREEMEDFAKIVEFDFIINTVLDDDGGVVRVVAGHIIDAHREGVKWGKLVCGAPFKEKTDITLSSSYPVDFDLFQAAKGIFSSTISTKEGGEIILVSPCSEGVSPTHQEYIELALLSDDELFRMANEELDKHDPMSITAALYFNPVKRLFKVTLVTDGISKEIIEKLGFNHLDRSDLQAYLDSRLKEDLSIGIVYNSAKLLPIED